MTARMEALHAFRVPLTRALTVGGCERTGLFITLGDESGAQGVGEIAPLPGWHTETTQDCLDALVQRRALLDALPLPLLKIDPAPLDLAPLFSALTPFVEWPSLHFGLTMAALNLLAARGGVWPARLLDREPLACVTVNALVMSPPDQWRSDTQRLVDEGFSIIKIKVGRTDPAMEAAALLALHKPLGDRVGLVLDGNRAWSLPEAEAFLGQLTSLPLHYCEELLSDPRGLTELQARSGVAMALDETLYDTDRYGDLVRDWPSTVVLKLDRIQGALPAGLTLAAAARGRGQTAIVSSAFNTVVGWSFLVQVAAALHCPHAGLDTLRAYPATLACDPACMHNGRIDVARSWVNRIDRLAPYIRKVST